MAQPPNSFQQVVNINTALGIPGEMSFDGPTRAKSYILNSSGTPNLVGNAFTVTNNANPDPAGNSGTPGTATVGGTGEFAGILVNPKSYASFGSNTYGPLGPTLQLPDNSEGELANMGEFFAYLPGPANVGDVVTYDPLTGNLNSIPPTTKFAGYIVAGGSAGVPDVLHVTAITAGNISIGQTITGTGVIGDTVVASLGTGLGGIGTYNLSSINQQTVFSSGTPGNMTAPNVPVPAATGAGYIAGTTLTITTASTGEWNVGQLVTGVGVLPNTVIIARSSGAGGTGTYTVNNTQTIGSSGTPISLATPSNIVIPRTKVGPYGASSNGGVASIVMTN